MFSSARPSTLGQRALGALRLTRSFLLLEDDYGVDWEVDDQAGRLAANHPHRAPLRGRAIPRRHGESPARTQVCLCPIAAPPATRRSAQLNASYKHTGVAAANTTRA